MISFCIHFQDFIHKLKLKKAKLLCSSLNQKLNCNILKISLKTLQIQGKVN